MYFNSKDSLNQIYTAKIWQPKTVNPSETPIHQTQEKIAQLSPSKILAHNVLAFTIKPRQQHHKHLKTAKPE
jgi:hypothetical protein